MIIMSVFQAWIEEDALEDYLRSCPDQEQETFLSDCDADMCLEEGREGLQSNKIFINYDGKFRRRMNTSLHCFSNQNDCLRTLTEYLEQDTSKDCRADSFKNLHSGTDLQCSWPAGGPEQARCVQRMFPYQPAAFTANQIVCCRGSHSTVFDPRQTGGSGSVRCPEDFSQCPQWTSWSGWEVTTPASQHAFNCFFQEFHSEPHRYRSRLRRCSECLAVDVQYKNVDWRKEDQVVEKFCGYDPVKENSTQCRLE